MRGRTLNPSRDDDDDDWNVMMLLVCVGAAKPFSPENQQPTNQPAMPSLSMFAVKWLTRQGTSLVHRQRRRRYIYIFFKVTRREKICLGLLIWGCRSAVLRARPSPCRTSKKHIIIAPLLGVWRLGRRGVATPSSSSPGGLALCWMTTLFRCGIQINVINCG